MSQSPAEYYRAQEVRASAEALRLENRALRVSRLRMVTFLGAAACILLLETTPRESWTVLLVSGGAGLVAFVGLVCLHRSLRKRSARERLREGISREARARLARMWAEVADPVAIGVRAGHPYAGDLDVVGRASLTHLLGRVTTIPGKAMLAHALLNPLARRPSSARVLLANSRNDRERPVTGPDPDWIEEVRRRQGVVRALAGEGSFRERLELLGREGQQSGATLERGGAFLAWLEEPRWLESHPAVLRTGRFLGVFTPASLVAWLVGWTPGLFPVLGAVGAFVLHRATAKYTAPTLRGAEAAQSVLGESAKLLEAAEEIPGESSLVAELRRRLRTPGPGAGRSIRLLVRLTDLANVRESLLHFPWSLSSRGTSRWRTGSKGGMRDTAPRAASGCGAWGKSRFARRSPASPSTIRIGAFRRSPQMRDAMSAPLRSAIHCLIRRHAYGMTWSFPPATRSCS